MPALLGVSSHSSHSSVAEEVGLGVWRLGVSCTQWHVSFSGSSCLAALSRVCDPDFLLCFHISSISEGMCCDNFHSPGPASSCLPPSGAHWSWGSVGSSLYPWGATVCGLRSGPGCRVASATSGMAGNRAGEAAGSRLTLPSCARTLLRRAWVPTPACHTCPCHVLPFLLQVTIVKSHH